MMNKGENKFVIGFPPHIRDKGSTTRIMGDVLIALIPACAAAIYYFGFSVLITMMLSVGVCVASEAVCQLAMKKRITVSDLSAAVTGLLLALTLPPGVPWYIPVVGGAFAIVIVKQCFGGLGNNFVNPALAARAMLLVAWPVAMTSYTAPLSDGVSSATPLAVMAEGTEMPALMDMFLGNKAGSMGEVCVLAIVIGAAYLLIRRVIHIRIPAAYIISALLFMGLFQGFENTAYNMLSGGLVLGAFFMATDYVTTPMSSAAQIIFGAGCGLITAVIRTFGGYPEGVCFAILIMNTVTPLLDKWIRPGRYGYRKGAKA